MRTRVCITTAFIFPALWGLAGCGSAPSVKTAEPVAPTDTAPAASPTSMPKPTGTPGPVGENFRLYADTPVLEMGAPGTWDSGLMDPGSVVFYENKFHMFFDGVPSWPALVNIGYAVSTDGLTFSRVSTDPVFTIDAIPWRTKPGNIRNNCILVENGAWIMYFTATEGLGSFAGVIGRATAASPTGPWIADPEPVLEPGDSTAWDAGMIGHVEVLRSGDGYVMYYSAALGIGMATSIDGIAWEKYNDPATDQPAFAASDPVMAKSGVEDPNVQMTPWGWAMAYRYKFSLYYAESDDGLHWKDAPTNPIITFIDKIIYYSSLLVKGDTAFLYFEAGGDTTSTYAATWTLTAPTGAE
jgi:hypothetical protein